MRAMGRSESMEIRDRFQHGMRVSAIRRETGRDRQTIREIVTAAAPRFLDAYTEYIRQRTQEGCGNSVGVFDAMRAPGYPGGLTLVRAFMARRRPVMTPVPVVRYETPAGRPAQCDGAAFGETEAPDGTVRKLWAFVYTLSYSRCLYGECVRDTTQDTLLTCLEHAFAHGGGVPEEILSDHRRPMVLAHPRGGPVTWHPRFLACARFPGFVPTAAEAYRAQTKGQGERPLRYLRGTFGPRVRTVVDDADWNRPGAHGVATVADARIHATLHATPARRRAADTAALTPWRPDHPYASSEQRPRRVGADGLVAVDGHAWRVPPAYVGQTVTVPRTRDGGCVIRVGTTELVRHGPPTGAHAVVTGDVPAPTPGPTATVAATGRGRLVLAAPDVAAQSLDQYAAGRPS